MRTERAINASAPVGEGEDTETSQEDLGNPGQQEGKQQPPVDAKSAAPQVGRRGRATGPDRLSHRILLNSDRSAGRSAAGRSAAPRRSRNATPLDVWILTWHCQ
jgi:hypothetical protein